MIRSRLTLHRCRSAIRALINQKSLWPRRRKISAHRFHQGIFYRDYLKRLHDACRPSNYFEIGVDTGATLALARCRAVAVDPKFRLKDDALGEREETFLFQMASDDFFARYDLDAFFPKGIDFAFLDGEHHFEQLLRDLSNTEKHSHHKTIVTLHDCCPVNIEMANRETNYDRRIDRPTRRWWTGDVWKLLPILREFRGDLDVTILDCPPTGLVIIRNLDADSEVLTNAYEEIVSQYRDVTLRDFGIDRFREEFPTSDSRAPLTNMLAD